MAAGNAVRAGRAYVELFVKDSRLIAGLESAGKRLKAFAAGLMSLGARLVGVGGVALGGFLAAGKSFADMGSSLVDMSQRTGVAVETLSELAFAAEQSGSSLEALETSLRIMQKTLVAAAGGSKEARAALADLGLSIDELAGLAPEDQLKRIADGLARINNPAARAAAALKVFGRSGTGLLPLMSGGAAGIGALQGQARGLGLTVSTKDATAAEALGDKFDALGKVFKKMIFNVGAALAPVLSELVERFSLVGSAIAQFISENRQAVVFAFQLAAGLVVGGAALVTFGVALSGLGSALSVFTKLGSLAASVAGALVGTIAAIASPLGLVVASLGALAAWFLLATKTGQETMQWLGQVMSLVAGDVVEAFGAIRDAIAGGDIAAAAQVLWALLRLEWKRGTTWLFGHWLRFKEGFMKLTTEIVFGGILLFGNLWAGVRKGWDQAITWLAQGWNWFAGLVTRGWNRVTAFLQKAWKRFISLFTEEDVSAELAQIDADASDENRRIQEEAAQANRRLQEEHDAFAQDVNRERQAAEEAIGRELNLQAELREKEAARAIDQAQAELATARAEFGAAVETAKAKRGAKEPGKAPVPPGLPDVPRIDFEALDVDAAMQKAKRSVAGTFSAAAVRGLAAGGDPAERTARNTEQLVKQNRELVMIVRNSGVVFT